MSEMDHWEARYVLARSLAIFRLSVLAFWHRLRHDLAREVVVLLSSLIVLATFFYVFNDFLNVEVATLSPAMRMAFAKVATVLTLAGSTVLAGRWIRLERTSDQTLTNWIRTLGEETSVIRLFAIFHAITLVVTIHGIGWWLNQRWLFRLSPWTGLILEIPMALGSIAWSQRPLPKKGFEDKAAVDGSSLIRGQEKSVTKALVSWRLTQILYRNSLCRLCLVLASALLLPVLWSGLRGVPPFIAAVSGLTAGFVASLSMIFFVAEDISQAWTERGAGISHGQFVRSYEELSWILGGAFAALASALFLASHLAHLGLSEGFGRLAVALLLGHTGKVFAVALLPLLVTPWLMFQIDAKRPWINGIVTLLISLFVGTAILASWLGILLIPLLRYYALQSQTGRFYRA
jgi:hypothetical protein